MGQPGLREEVTQKQVGLYQNLQALISVKPMALGFTLDRKHSKNIPSVFGGYLTALNILARKGILCLSTH
jgi:hypothetical protein